MITFTKPVNSQFAHHVVAGPGGLSVVINRQFKQWMNDHCGEQYGFSHSDRGWAWTASGWAASAVIKIHIASASDAVLFKLTWGGDEA